jgi:alcohol dehydrogenase (cytochrome c)
VLTGMEWQGKPRKVMLWANRNGFYYVLERTTGQFLMAKAFVKQNWNVGFDENGRPIKSQALSPKPMNGPHVEPGTQGGTNWYSPSFSPNTGLFYIPTWENSGAPAGKSDPGKWVENQRYMGAGGPGGLGGGSNKRAVGVAYRRDGEGYGAVRAIDPRTGEKNGISRWWTTPRAVS